MPPKKQPLGLIPNKKKNYLFQSHKKKNSFEKGWNYPILPSSKTLKKNLLKKKKKKFNPSSPFVKASFTTCNSFNRIELSLPYTH